MPINSILQNLVVQDVRDIQNGVVALPDSPGIYAWFKRLELRCTNNADFVADIQEILSIQWLMSIDGDGEIGKYYAATLELYPLAYKLSQSKLNIAQTLSTAEKQAFSDMLVEISILQSPLYVGKADNLRVRIVDGHLKHRSGFINRVSSRIDPSQMLLAYIEMNSLPDRVNELLESMITVASMAWYVDRIG